MKDAIFSLLKKSPGMKGREIAKKISEDRKAVNAFLHENTDIFSQDASYQWSLVAPPEIRIELDGKWVDADCFEDSLAKASSPLDADETHVIIVLPDGCSVLLEPACRMLALCNQLIDAGKDVTIDFTACKKALTYFDRIGFFDSLNKNCIVLPKWPRSSRAMLFKGNSQNVVEFGLIDPAHGEEDLNAEDKVLVNQLTGTFVKLVDDNYEDVASVIFSELIGNIKRHSQTGLRGIAGLQKYSGKNNHIQTIISDSGIGIATTLKTGLETHYPNLFKKREQDDYDIFLVEEALTKGQISRFGKGNGLGFGITTKKAMKFHASLSVRQETFSIKFYYENEQLVKTEKRKGLSKIYGTHLCFDFRID
jgi:hypothetical protein